MAAWRTKLVLDYAFLFSFCSKISEYFVNVEDDAEPAENYVSKIRNLVEREKNVAWVSLRMSQFLSIGRLYRSFVLPHLVSFLLSAYTQQPVDYLMQHFDRIFLANLYRGSRISEEPIFSHRGRISSKESLKDSNINFDLSKAGNPKGAILSTNMRTVGSNNVSNAYYSVGVSYFKGANVKSDGLKRIDIKFAKPERVAAVRVITGHRQGNDRALAMSALAARDECAVWVRLTVAADGRGRFRFGGFYERLPTGVSCLRFIFPKTQTDQLVVKLIAVATVRPTGKAANRSKVLMSVVRKEGNATKTVE